MISGGWVKSSYSNGSGGSNCVEVKANSRGEVQVRDSKLGDDSPVLVFNQDHWEVMLGEIRRGFVTPVGGMIATWAEGDSTTMYHRSDIATRLTFTRQEWNAFVDGVHDGEFDLSRL